MCFQRLSKKKKKKRTDGIFNLKAVLVIIHSSRLWLYTDLLLCGVPVILIPGTAKGIISSTAFRIHRVQTVPGNCYGVPDNCYVDFWRLLISGPALGEGGRRGISSAAIQIHSSHDHNHNQKQPVTNSRGSGVCWRGGGAVAEGNYGGRGETTRWLRQRCWYF